MATLTASVAGNKTDPAPRRRARIDSRIAELQRLKAGLTECIGCGCLSLGRCALANPADRAARLGPGPRYWIGDRAPKD